MQFTINRFRELFRDKIFSLTIPWFSVKSWHFPDSCQIPWHFQVFQTSGHPAYRPTAYVYESRTESACLLQSCTVMAVAIANDYTNCDTRHVVAYGGIYLIFVQDLPISVTRQPCPTTWGSVTTLQQPASGAGWCIWKLKQGDRPFNRTENLQKKPNCTIFF